MSSACTVFENHRGKSHSILRVKRAKLAFCVDKSSLKSQKVWRGLNSWGQTVLPDKCDILSNFQTMWFDDL